MTREEYEKAKKVLLDQRVNIDKALDELRKKFEDKNLEEHNINYVGKYIVEYDRESYLNPGVKAKLLKYTFDVYHIKKVTLIGNGFIRVIADWIHMYKDVENNFGNAEVTVDTDRECDIHHFDEVFEEDEANEFIKKELVGVKTIVESVENLFTHK